MIVAASVGFALAAIVVMSVEAALTYRRLPASIPLHFGWRGEPGTYGPKAIFAALFAAFAIGFGYSLVLGLTAAGSHRETATFSAATNLAFLAFVHHAIIDAVLNRDGRLAVRPFYVALSMLIALDTAATRLR